MKRHPSLHPLSDDHHRALVLARRLRRSAAGRETRDFEALSREVQGEFKAALEPHFRVEEQWLFPVLEAKGAEALAGQARRDHARLRLLVGGPWSRDTAEQLGTLLEKHVRFEERVLFPKAEALLSDAELACVREASEKPEIHSGKRQ